MLGSPNNCTTAGGCRDRHPPCAVRPPGHVEVAAATSTTSESAQTPSANFLALGDPPQKSSSTNITNERLCLHGDLGRLVLTAEGLERALALTNCRFGSLVYPSSYSIGPTYEDYRNEVFADIQVTASCCRKDQGSLHHHLHGAERCRKQLALLPRSSTRAKVRLFCCSREWISP